jgi:hypothetical protein
MIVVSFILLNGLGIMIGILLSDLNISTPASAMLVCCSIYMIGIAAYPSRAEKGKKINAAILYLKQKSCDFILAACSFFMITYVSNHPQVLFQQYPVLNASVSATPSLPKDSTIKAFRSINGFSASLKDENGKILKWKERKKLLKDQINGIKKSNDISKDGKAVLIFLSVLVALGLLFLVAALSCDLSCSGSDGLALLVGVGGTALIIFLLVLAIRAINGKMKKKKMVVKQPATGD